MVISITSSAAPLNPAGGHSPKTPIVAPHVGSRLSLALAYKEAVHSCCISTLLTDISKLVANAKCSIITSLTTVT